MSIEADRQRYEAATHAMQAGVAMKTNYDPTELQAKHLRVGVNSAMIETSALAALLIDKGIITEAEFVSAIAGAMEKEAESYRADIQARFPNTEVTLT